MEPGSEIITAADGYPIAVTRFHGKIAPHAQLVIAGATAVPQRFYRRFAQYASERGYLTRTLDYRGIGESRPAQLKGFSASFLDWARQDLAAVIDAAVGDGLPIFLLGHSFGGHALGLLPNHRHIRAAGFYAVGAGWHGHMRPLEGLRISLMWNVVMPPLVRWKGYLPASLLGMGEDLPFEVYRQWRRWCGFPHYFFDDPDMADEVSRFAQVRAPIRAVNALDDAWALPRSRDAFLEGYPNAPIERVDVDPQPFGGIGHMGYFRVHAEPLWRETLDWFDLGLRKMAGGHFPPSIPSSRARRQARDEGVSPGASPGSFRLG